MIASRRGGKSGRVPPDAHVASWPASPPARNGSQTRRKRSPVVRYQGQQLRDSVRSRVAEVRRRPRVGIAEGRFEGGEDEAEAAEGTLLFLVGSALVRSDDIDRQVERLEEAGDARARQRGVLVEQRRLGLQHCWYSSHTPWTSERLRVAPSSAAFRGTLRDASGRKTPNPCAPRPLKSRLQSVC